MIPPSFNFNFKMHDIPTFARITYSFEAFVPSPNPRTIPPVQMKYPFYISAREGKLEGNQPIKADIDKNVTVCGCCKKGSVRIKAYFEKKNFCFGENTNVIAEVDNSECSASIERIQGEFNMHLKLSTPRYSTTEVIKLNVLAMDGCEPGKKFVGENALRFPLMITGHPMAPTVATKLIVNQFSLDVKAVPGTFQCSCCDESPTARLYAVVSNKPPRPKPVVWQQPEGWSPQVMSAFQGTVEAQQMNMEQVVEEGQMNQPGLPQMGQGAQGYNHQGGNAAIELQTKQGHSDLDQSMLTAAEENNTTQF
jgi:hypothetical protein